MERKKRVRRTTDRLKIRLTSTVLGNFDAFLQDVAAFRGPEKDRIEVFILRELLPYIESHAVRSASICCDTLEVLARLGSPTLMSPRIAKRSLKLLDTLVIVDLGKGVTNVHIVGTEKCLREPIVDGSFRNEPAYDQRRRIDVYCNVLMAMLIGRAYGHLTYPFTNSDKEDIQTELEKIIPLLRKSRTLYSLKIILNLLECMLDKKRMLKRLTTLMDMCERMLEGFDEGDVDALLLKVDRVENGAVHLHIVMKMLHGKANGHPRACEILNMIVTKHELFSSSWSHTKERDHWLFALLACQILVDVTKKHRVKATRVDAARCLSRFRETKAYKKSVVICDIVEKHFFKAAFAPDVESRRILLENRFKNDLQEKLPLELLRKRLCTFNQSGDLELISSPISEHDDHVTMRGLFNHKPVAVKTISVNPLSKLFTAQDQETSPAEKRFENEVAISGYLNNKSNEHVPVCYAADTIYLPYHMISEHLENGDLLSYLKNRREQHSPSYREVLEICTASAKTMEFLHKNRVVHNHLCAEHLLVGETIACIKITSFGRARHATEKEFQEGYQGECISSFDPAVRWAAPEVMRQTPLFSFKSDVWAFGILMYEVIMCGMVPYMNKDLKEVREDVS
ncbi:hypothetical protein QZH41_003424 [Actinostola sp. cb2023]|nr:hypothetical protein QZH41_003424 [Actinostola sp. cb2023]